MSKRQKIECAVCVEDTAPSKVVKCPFCDFSCCKSCFTRVLFDGSNDANCMNCHRRFDREILINVMSNHFVNTQYCDSTGATADFTMGEVGVIGVVQLLQSLPLRKCIEMAHSAF